MDILEKGKLLLFVLFIMPGFISMRVYRLFHPSTDTDISTHPFWYYVFYFFVLIITPVLLPIILLMLRRSNRIRQFLPHPTGRAWDYFFFN